MKYHQKHMQKWIEPLKDLLFPERCNVCGVLNDIQGRGICRRCLEQVCYLSSSLCSCCGRPYDSSLPLDHHCEKCIRQPPPFSCARGIAFYEDPVKQLLHNLKYRFDTTAVEPLLQIAQGFDFSAFESCEIIIPVPLHVNRLRKRGMNQSLTLARLLFPHRRTDIFFDTLLKKRPTASQTLLDIDQRRKNVKNSFLVKKPLTIRNKVICLVDDVYTTGATAEECSRQLLIDGGAEVRVLTFARVRKAR